jgi:hypothetical protein
MTSALPDNSSILAHYESNWGSANRILEIHRSRTTPPGIINVTEHAAKPNEHTWVYATLGISRYPMPYLITGDGKATTHRIELFIYSKTATQELANLLISLGEYPFDNNTFLGIGHTIPGDSGIVPEAALSDVLFLKPYNEPDAFEFLQLTPELHIQMLWVVPIFRSERQLVLEHGWRALVQKFSEAELDSADFFRAPVA